MKGIRNARCPGSNFIIVFLLAIPAIGARAQVKPLEVSALKQLTIEELTDMEVTSVSRHAEKLSQVASAVQVITQDDIRNSGATTITEVLRLSSNLQVAQVNASQWAISARGFNNVLANKLLVLIDGRVVYTPMYAGVFWDVQNLLLEDIDRIEVISGPGGTLWGSNAVNGVINIITKSADRTTGLFAEAAIGTELRGLGSLRYGGRINNHLSYRIFATAFKRDNTNFTDSIEANDHWHMGQGGFRLDWDFERDDVSIIANIYNGRPNPDGTNSIVASGDNVLFRWKRNVSEISALQVQTFYDHTWRDFKNGFTERLYTLDAEAQHSVRLAKRHQIIYGGGFRYMDHDVSNLELFGFDPARKALHVLHMFLQDEATLFMDKLYLTLGMKLEHSTYAQFQHQPSGKISFTPNAKNTIWAAVSRAVRLPARLDRDFFLKASAELPLLVGSDMKPEQLLAYELGWRTQANKVVSVSLSTFYNKYDQIRSVEPGPPPFGIPLTLGNGVKGNTYGAELATTARVTNWWHLRGGYTLLRKDLHVKPNSGDRNNASAESNDPKYQLLAQSSMMFQKGLGLGVVFRYIGDLPNPSVPGYAGLDVRISWQFAKMLEAAIVGQNLIKNAHTEYIPSSPPAKEIERGLYAKIVCRY